MVGPQLPKPDVPKKVLKADLKALAGEPVSKKEEIHAEPKADSRVRRTDGRRRTRQSGLIQKQSAKSDSSSLDSQGIEDQKAGAAPTTVKKVVVPADDDDPPVEGRGCGIEVADPASRS